MDEKSLEILGFHQIRQILAGFTAFSASRELALELRPSPDFQRVTTLLKQSAEARHLLAIEPGFSIGTVSDIRQAVEMASIGKVLESHTLVEIRNTLAAVHLTRRRLSKLSTEVPLLWKIAEPVAELEDIVRRVDRCLAPDGAVLDRASDQLATLRKRMADLKGRIFHSLKAIMASAHSRDAIQEPIIVERQGRQVIPVKIERRKDIKGIVHDVSNTGATVYVEPLATIDLGNSFREATVEEQREVERILAELSAEVGKHNEEIARNIALTAELDLVLARARYAYRVRAVEPGLVNLSLTAQQDETHRQGRLCHQDDTHQDLSSDPQQGTHRQGRLCHQDDTHQDLSSDPQQDTHRQGRLCHQDEGQQDLSSDTQPGTHRQGRLCHQDEGQQDLSSEGQPEVSHRHGGLCYQGLGHPLKLVEARHPLLGANAVPLSVEIGRDFLVLVITGPNTGGKTVALKTIGLLSLMAQAGIPIPAAAESRIPVFDQVFADIGDEQSIEHTLSTFSWHMGNLVRIIEHGTARSLVLLDELGTSTDPIEGAALAIAVLRHFLERRIMTVATTHFAELKAFASATPGVQNASFDFDPVTLKHTYHLTVGIPGGSNALAVASRLGLPAEIIADAERLVPGAIKEMEALLASLKTRELETETLRQEAEKAKEEAARRTAEIEAGLKQMELDRQEAKAELRRAVREARDKVSLEAADLRREIREATADLRKEKTKPRVEQARKALSTVQEHLAAGALNPAKDETPAGGTPETVKIAVGDSVRLREVGVTATVVSVSEARQEVEVEAAGARIRVSLDEVDKVASPSGEAVPETRVTRALRPPVSPELDLRGKRAEEVETLLEQYLDDASLSTLREVRIIHGFGTGVVRQMVRKRLAGHPLVKAFRPGERGEGGDGVTIAQM